MNYVTLADNNEGLGRWHIGNPFKAVAQAANAVVHAEEHLISHVPVINTVQNLVTSEKNFVLNNPLRAAKDTIGLGLTLQNRLTQVAIPAALNYVAPGSGAVFGGIAKNVFGKLTDLEYKALSPTGIRADEGATKFFNNKIVDAVLTAGADVAGGAIAGKVVEDLALTAAKKLGGQLIPIAVKEFMPKPNMPTFQQQQAPQKNLPVYNLPTQQRPPQQHNITPVLLAGFAVGVAIYLAKTNKII